MIGTVGVLTLLVVGVTANTYCFGNMVWNPRASVCIVTCPQRYYYQECPSRYLARCDCPASTPVLQREHEYRCVAASQCEPADWFKLGPAGLGNFKFSTEPESRTVTLGNSVTLSCFVAAARPVQYFWYKMESLPSGDMTSVDNLRLSGSTTVRIDKAAVSDTGYYQCKARSQDGYSLLSRVSHVQVKHTSFDPTVKTSDGVVTNKARAILKCNKAGASYPRATIQWTKDGNSISEADIFMNSKVGGEGFGDLYILNVKESHAGIYKCIATVKDNAVGGTFVLSEVDFRIRGSQNQVSAAPLALENASYGDKVKRGQTGTLYCGAYGYPPAEYTWAKATSIQQATSITGCGERACVEDYGRRLVLHNVQQSDYGGYFCQVGNSVGLNSLVLTLEEEPSSYDINFLGISPSYTITPNRYQAFNLTCAVDIVSSDAVYIGWYKDGESVSGSTRIYTEDVLTSQSRIRKLVFKHPTDGDPGLYQCLAYNSQQFVQASTYVVLNREPDLKFTATYEIELFKERKSIEGAHVACADWKPGAKLVSILNHDENDRVFQLLQDNHIDKAWIGITDEAQEGVWTWLTSEESTTYSNWLQEEPDDGGPLGSDYAVMSLPRAGRWEDVSNTDTAFPYVCKHYNASCPLLGRDEAFKGFPVAHYTKEAGTIRVFDTAAVSCKSGQTVTLVCNPDGKWGFQDRTVVCEAAAVHGGSSRLLYTSSLMALSIVISILR